MAKKNPQEDAIKKANEAAKKAAEQEEKKKVEATKEAEKAEQEKEAINLQEYVKNLEAKIAKYEKAEPEEKAVASAKGSKKGKVIGSKELGFHEIVEGEQSSTFLYAVIEQEEWVRGKKLSSPIISTYRLGDWLTFLSHGEGQQWTIQEVLYVPKEWGSELPLSYDQFFQAQQKEIERRRAAEEKMRKARAAATDKPRERVFIK